LDFSVFCHILTIAVQFQFVMPGQLRHEALVRIRFRPTQIMVEVNYREHNTEFVAQFKQQPQECDRISPTRDRDSCPIAGSKKALPPNVLKNVLR